MTLTPGVILIMVALALMAWGLTRTYRSLTRLDRQVHLAWNQVERAYACRREMVRELLVRQGRPNGPAADAVKALTDAWAMSVQATDPLARRQGEAELGAALKVLLQHPAAETVLGNDAWRERLATVTHRLRMAQRFYNDQALVYNTKISTMPLALAARLGGLRPADLTDGDDQGT